MPTLKFKDCDFEKTKPWQLHGVKVWSLLNLANKYAAPNGGATTAEHIGSTTETWNESQAKSKKEFLEAHNKRNPGLIQKAKERIKERLRLMARQTAEMGGLSTTEPGEESNVHELIDRFVDDLVTKGYTGKRIEQEILAKEAGVNGFTPASAEMEKKNVDGIIKEKTYSIKPDTYTEKQIHELGTDIVITYEKPKFDKKTCVVTVNYTIHNFTQNG